jgi:hypothetical protein
MNDSSVFINHPYFIAIASIYILLKMIPYSALSYIEDEFKRWFLDENNECSIIVPYHVKMYSGGFTPKPIEKTLYSERFRAINYYIIKNHLHRLFSLTEIINFENSKYLEDESNYILLPRYNQKIKICEKEDIYFEIFLERKSESENGKKESAEENHILTKKYIYKLYKKGKENIHILHSFLEKLLENYTNEILNKSIQMVFHYQKQMRDEEDEILTLFKEMPFKTNKNFENLFFDGISEFIEYISQFSLKRDPKEREIIQKNYEKAGIPYKSVLLLHGDPGCGKSSLIKATIDYTGRHCILVSWSKIRTCNDFASLFRPLKINQKTYYSNELILVFEDFDANNNDIIKKRKNMKIHDEKNENKRENEETDSEISTIEESIKTKILNEFKLTPQKLEDEITLEFILNVLDGIIELYDIIVFFTTNDIDIIDPALKRTGRIDKIIKMEKANCKNICEMLAHRYNLSETELKKYETEINLVPEYENSYSDISQICNYSKTVEECLSNIVKMKK